MFIPLWILLIVFICIPSVLEFVVGCFIALGLGIVFLFIPACLFLMAMVATGFIK